MNGQDKLHSGSLYLPDGDDIIAEQKKCMELLYDFNHTRPSEGERREQLLKQMFGKIGEGCYIEPPFYANWAGRHVHFGSYVYATCVDDTHIYVGDHTMFGPNVVLASANHPLLPRLREQAYQYNLPIYIGRNCWLGAGVIVVPGVAIGDNAVIGAGSVVTRDIPAGTLAVGNPCRVLRELSRQDEEYYYRDRRINWEELPGLEAPPTGDPSCQGPYPRSPYRT